VLSEEDYSEMTESNQYDLLVIGAGPGGYVSAIRAAQLKMRTAIIEKDLIGGVCLNWGCIPSKALINQARIFESAKDLEMMGVKIDTSNFNYALLQKKSRDVTEKLSKGISILLKKNKIKIIKGTATIVEMNKVLVDDKKQLTANNILIATGSSPKTIPGLECDEKDVLTSTGALSLTKLPESIMIVGAGAIGVEFAYIFSSFGVKIHLVEIQNQILPFEDRDIAEFVAKAFRRKSIIVHTSAEVKTVKKEKNKYKVDLKSPDGETEIVVEKILIAAGRQANSKNLGIDKLAIEIEDGFIAVSDFYQTTKKHIYAIGDVINSPPLAHVAAKEGEIAVEHMAGLEPEPHVKIDEIPNAVYCEPEVASFGLTEKISQIKKILYEKTIFPYTGIGISVATDRPDGFVKILYDPKTTKILGAQIAGKHASEILHEILIAKKNELLPENIANTIHAHPTFSEAIMEAARAVEGEPIHI
jgi:dihydrolipoamide dehydrogenase